MKKAKIEIDELMATIEHRLGAKSRRTEKIFGIPKGGWNIAYLLAASGYGEITYDVREATLIVDDIVDSGRTKDRYRALNEKAKFFAPFDKTKEPDLPWIVFPWDEGESNSIEDCVVRQLQFMGEDVNREGLLETPKRVVKSWGKIFGGYKEDPKDHIKLFSADGCDEVVLLKNIEFYSSCEHHMQPFFGKAHIAYIPNKKVIGVSKLARILEVYTRRLQIQERIGTQVADVLWKELNPLGAACVLEAKHFCMVCRGVEKQNSTMITSALRGVFKKDAKARSELMSMIQK